MHRQTLPDNTRCHDVDGEIRSDPQGNLIIVDYAEEEARHQSTMHQRIMHLENKFEELKVIIGATFLPMEADDAFPERQKRLAACFSAVKMLSDLLHSARDFTDENDIRSHYAAIALEFIRNNQTSLLNDADKEFILYALELFQALAVTRLSFQKTLAIDMSLVNELANKLSKKIQSLENILNRQLSCYERLVGIFNSTQNDLMALYQDHFSFKEMHGGTDHLPGSAIGHEDTNTFHFKMNKLLDRYTSIEERLKNPTGNTREIEADLIQLNTDCDNLLAEKQALFDEAKNRHEALKKRQLKLVTFCAAYNTTLETKSAALLAINQRLNQLSLTLVAAENQAEETNRALISGKLFDPARLKQHCEQLETTNWGILKLNSDKARWLKCENRIDSILSFPHTRGTLTARAHFDALRKRVNDLHARSLSAPEIKLQALSVNTFPELKRLLEAKKKSVNDKFPSILTVNHSTPHQDNPVSTNPASDVDTIHSPTRHWSLPPPKKAGFFKRHWKAILFGGLLVAGAIAITIGTCGFGAPIGAGIVAAAGAIGLGMSAAVGTGIGVGLAIAGGALIGATSGAMVSACCNSIEMKPSRLDYQPLANEEPATTRTTQQNDAMSSTITSSNPARREPDPSLRAPGNNGLFGTVEKIPARPASRPAIATSTYHCGAPR